MPSLSIRESLWVDELHSVWVIAGDWSEVKDRAAFGNQSPLYFYGLKAWSIVASVFHSDDFTNEVTLRGSSLLGWVTLCYLMLKTIRRQLRSTTPFSMIGVIVCWLLLDRIGAFYAIELRPYLWVSVLSLLVMLSAAKLAEQPTRFGYVWLFLSAIAFYFHYTSIIVIMFSWLGRIAEMGLRWKRIDVRIRTVIIRLRIGELAILAGLIAPGCWQLKEIFSRSQQWASFAGDSSFEAMMRILPWFSLTIIPMVASLIHARLCQFIQPKIETEGTYISDPRTALAIQFGTVAVGTLTFVWMLTNLEFAPLVHRRYVMGAYPAIVLLGAYWLGRIQSRSTLLLTGFLSTMIMVWCQGTISEWQDGRYVAWQRQEDWRDAIAFLNQHRHPDEPIFLAPLLIETTGTTIDPSISTSYLRFPLMSLYKLDCSDSIHLLPNARSRWVEGIASVCGEKREKPVWIVARIESFGVETSDFEIALDGGRVQVLKLK